jgi:DNA-binding transcriptional LysR family regulator
MDRLTAMTAFVRVVEAGSFTKAAETLDVANATITRLVQNLEQDLRVRLLHRTTRSVTVTAEGAVYYERVLRLLSELEDIESQTKQATGKPTGRVRVETAAALATSVIVPRLHEFQREYPGVEIELSIGTKYADLIAEGIDCAIRAGEPREQQMVARRIGSFRIVTCASPQLLERHEPVRRPEDLERLPSIGLVLASGTRARGFTYVSPDGGAEQEFILPHSLIVDDVNAYVRAAEAGLGVIQGPSYALLEGIEQGRLVELLAERQGPPRSIYVMYAPNRHLSAKVRVFIDWIVALMERDPQLRPA